MQTTHDKAIKYLGIATIVLAGLTLLGCLIGMVGVGALSAYTQSAYPGAEYGYGYGYGHHGMMASGSYSDVAGLALATGIANALMFWKLACAVVALIAGIMAVRLKAPSAHSLRTVFIWAVVAAICSLLSGSFITMTLLIIIAVFAEMDRRALDGSAPVAPKPAAPATPAPANAAYAAAYGDGAAPAAAAGTAAAVAAPAPVATPAPAPAVAPEVTEAPVVPAPAVAENQAIAEEAAAAVAIHEAEVEAVEEVTPANDAPAEATQAAAAAEDAHIAQEGQAAADFYQDNAAAVTEAADTVAEATIEVETTAPATMENEGEAEELKADKAMTKEQDSPEQL